MDTMMIECTQDSLKNATSSKEFYRKCNFWNKVKLIVWTIMAVALTSHISTNKIVFGEKVCVTTEINEDSMLYKILECEVIEGSLTIANVNFSNVNFAKTSPLREITGYLFIYRVSHLESLEQLFPNLVVIRGEALFGSYALVVHENWDLRELGLVSLISILKGSVRITKNPVLCYVHTVSWFYLLQNMTEQHFVLRNNFNQNHCPLCYDNNDKAKLPTSNSSHFAYCWGSKKYQKICPIECEKGSCNSKGECCHSECLSDCSDLKLTQCEVCRHFKQDEMCVERCDSHFFKLENYRCLSALDCENAGRLPYEEICSDHCPLGWVKVNKSCEKCTAPCVGKRCFSGIIKNSEDAKTFNNCTHIDGNLDIQLVEKQSHIVDELENNLSNLLEISGYLRIRNSPQITSLSFFKSLKKIKGEYLAEKQYALIVTENYHLEHIWNENQTVEIDNGILSFHFNPKLCYEKIEALTSSIKEEKNRKLSSNDVSPYSNGDGVVCGPNLTNLTAIMEEVNSTAVRIKITPLLFEDWRTFLGYFYYYTEAPEQNLSVFDSRHGCGYDRWKFDLDLSKNVRHVISGLKPYTQYGFFVKTFTVSNSHVKKDAYSEVSYFQTLPGKPGPISKFYADVRSDTEVVLHWWPPIQSRGPINYYLLRLSKDLPLEQHREMEIQNLAPKNSSEPVYDSVEREVYNKRLIDTKLNVTLNCKCAAEDYWRGYTPVHHQYYDEIEVIFEDAVADFVFIPTYPKEVRPRNNSESGTVIKSPKQELWNQRLEDDEKKALEQFDTGINDFPIDKAQQECHFGKCRNEDVNVDAGSHKLFPNITVLEGHIHKHSLQRLDPSSKYRFAIRACIEGDFKTCGTETVLNVTTPNTLVFPGKN